MNDKINQLTHPLIQHKISLLRDQGTSCKIFRDLIHEIATLMCFEATRNLELAEEVVQTPLEITHGHFLLRPITLVPVLRAGLGMVEAFSELIPSARIGHIGLYRDHATLTPVEYYCKLPSDVGESDVFVLDPMLATGGSAAAAVDFIKKRGAKRISFLCIIASPEGITTLHEKHPDVEIYCGAVDRELNSEGYILPGLGDAGDRVFGTL